MKKAAFIKKGQKQTFSKEWVLTDPATNQYGRQLTPVLFEFKEIDREQTCIDVSGYTNEVIESAINAYGYTLYPTEIKETQNCQYIYDLYENDTNWIIAECLFELDIN